MHIKYSNDGGKTFTENSGESVGTYIGQYVDFTQDDSTNVSDYKWAKIEGQKGETGDAGEKGDTGIGVEEVVEQYYLSTSNTTQVGGQWKENQDEWIEGTYIWTRSKVTWTDGNITYTTPVLANAINNANSNASNALDQVGNITNTKEEAEGKFIHINDSAEEPLVDISLHGESIQEGTPTPDNPIEIENVEGKNLLQNKQTTQTINGVTFTVNKDKSVTLSGTATTNILFYLNDSNLYTEDIKERTYAFSGCKGGSSSTYYLALELETANSSGAKYFNLTETNISAKGFLPVDINSQNKYRTYIYVKSGAEVNATVYPQLEEGTVATPYKPYNTLEVKVEGKNLLDINAMQKGRVDNGIIGYGSNITKLETEENKIIFQSNNAYRGIVSDYILVKPKCCYVIHYISVNKLVAYADFFDKNNNWISKANFNNAYITTPSNCHYMLVSFMTGSNTDNPLNTDIVISNIQLEEGTEPTDYEPYKSKTAYFPLTEKLMEGSYLADDGVHNKKKQVVLDGTEDWYLNTASDFALKGNGYKTLNDSGKCISSHYPYSTGGEYDNYIRVGNVIFIMIKDIRYTTIEEFKTYLAEQYANGTPVIVEYELAEEEMVPYTEEQQEEWNKIKALNTYKNITNITSEAYAKVVYMRDNGLDVYETKQNADRRYTETNEKFAEQKITVDGVITQVSDTNKRLTNEYLTAEQVNAELDTTNENIEILSQKQAKTELTSEQFRIEIDKIVNEGVSKVKTSMGYTFDDEGFKLDREGAETGTIIDEAKIKVVDKTGSGKIDLLYAGYVKEGNADYPEYVGQTIVASANMIVKNYLVVPNSRFEKYENPVLGGQGTGAFEV